MLDYGAGARAVAGEAILDAAETPRAPARFALADLFAIALRRKLLILAVALACAAIGFALTKTLTPRYLATAQIYLDPRGLPGLENDSNPGQDSTGFINFVETQTRIITSQVVLERVVAAENLTSDPEFGASSSFLSRLFGRGGAAETESEAIAGAIRALGARIAVRRPERTFIIDISATSNDANKSARIANAVAQAYIDVRAAMHSDAARQAATSFTARLDGLRERLIGAEKQVEAYKAAHGFVGTRDAYVNEQSLKELNQQLTFARARLEDARSRYEQVQRARRSDGDVSAIAATLSLATLTSLRSQQAEALQKLADLSAELGPRHPVVKNAAARAAEARRLVDAELARVAASVRKDFERAQSTEEALTREVERLEQKAVASGEASVKLRDLEREVEVSRSIYESFLTRSRQTGEARQLDSASTHIITMASPPIARSFPPGAALMAGAGLVIGSGLGLALAFWREHATGAQGSVPAAPKRLPATGRQAESFTVTEATRFTVREAVDAPDEVELTRLGIPFVRPFADRRELDAVARRLGELAGKGPNPVVIGVVGDAPGAVRTIMAVNIALALRLRELQVALLDADEYDTALTVLVEDGVDALDVSAGPYLATRDSILLALPSLGDDAASREAITRILRDFRAGAPAKAHVVLCDGVALEKETLGLVDWIVPVLGREQDDESDVARLVPEEARSKIALILRFDHSNPWLARGGEARKSA